MMGYWFVKEFYMKQAFYIAKALETGSTLEEIRAEANRQIEIGVADVVLPRRAETPEGWLYQAAVRIAQNRAQNGRAANA